MSIKKFGLDVKKIVDNLIKQTHEDKLKWQGLSVNDSRRIRMWRIEHPDQGSYGVSLVRLESIAV
ncbi:MAG: hypothetical protein Q8N56_01860, partial [bacterium]|nr:hypothetical protein [bacterium]